MLEFWKFGIGVTIPQRENGVGTAVGELLWIM